MTPSSHSAQSSPSDPDDRVGRAPAVDGGDSDRPGQADAATGGEDADPNRPNPMKGLRGIMAGTLILEMIVVLLALTVIARVDGGSYFTAPRVAYVVVLAVAMFLLCAKQSKPWAVAANVAVGVVAVLAGGWVHPSLLVVGGLFALVWGYILYVRAEVKRRIEAGTLPSIEVRGA